MPDDLDSPNDAPFPAHVKRAFVSLRHSDFRYLASGTLALGFGQWFQTIGLGWLILQATNSPLQMAGVASLRGTVFFVAAPLGGILSDRYNRKDVALWSTGLASLQAIAISLLVLTQRVEIWHIYLFTALEGVASAVYMPARQALVFDTVPRESLPNAVAMNSISQNLARVSGPALAGAVIGLTGSASSAFLILAVVKGLATVLTVPIRTVQKQQIAVRSESPLANLTTGFAYAFKDPRILGLMISGTIPAMMVYPYLQMLPFFAENVLHRGASGYGLLATAVGWGSLVGLAGLIFAGDIRRKGIVLLVTIFLYIVFVAAFARSTVFEISMTFLILAGIFISWSGALTNTLFQLIVPDEFRGRALSLYSMSHGLQPLGALPMAVAIEAWGPANGVFLFALLAGAMILALAAFSRPLRDIRV